MKLYLNIIRGNLEVRTYKTKRLVYVFNSKNVLAWINSGREKEYYRESYCINDVYNYLWEIGLIWINAFGHERLTIKGLNLYWWRHCRKKPDFTYTQEKYEKLVKNMDKFYWED